MKKFLLMSLLSLHFGNGLYAAEMQEPLPTAVSDDAEMMFDEIPDALDAITANDCKCSPEKITVGNPSLLQSCYQTALMYLLSTYLSAKHTCSIATDYVMQHLPSFPWISSAPVESFKK